MNRNLRNTIDSLKRIIWSGIIFTMFATAVQTLLVPTERGTTIYWVVITFCACLIVGSFLSRIFLTGVLDDFDAAITTEQKKTEKAQEETVIVQGYVASRDNVITMLAIFIQSGCEGKIDKRFAQDFDFLSGDKSLETALTHFVACLVRGISPLPLPDRHLIMAFLPEWGKTMIEDEEAMKKIEVT